MVSKVLRKMIVYFQEDIKRVNHAIKVYGFAKTISGNEFISEKYCMVIELAAVLHVLKEFVILDVETIKNIKDKYFKTVTGIKILESLYIGGYKHE